MRVLLAALFCLLIPMGSAFACGPDTDCVIGERTYRIKMPEGHDGTTPVGAIVHAHGYRGTAAGVMRNKGLSRMASRLGVALIAPKSGGDDWIIPGAPRRGDVDGSVEFNYFEAMLSDAAARFPIDRARLMASGFSAGGMMVWNLACYRGDMFAGFAPISGTFWEPVPDACASAPVNLIHTHGTSDKVVPIEGRRIADTKQGSVTKALSLFERLGEFGAPTVSVDGELTCSRRTNGGGKILEYCTHPGGHSIKSKWLERAWRRFENVNAL